ncbi:hypothetical protein LQF76_05915 [Gloeomargaritales cyanobacterium VI4D9]|nr:hypothetical protein LQF76_12975 [Gloeomargaritales cyanobacterium VI4D9]WAS06415.1 hypothetical protein LQF76_05915 [Gloeomargaritales cyanobacterium VI4D9]
MSIFNVPRVGAGYGGGVVTARRKDTATGLVELQVNGQWLVFAPQVKTAETSDQPYKDETNLKTAETSAGDDISIKPGDTIRLVNRHCWEAQLWPVGTQATVKLVWENGTRLVIETPKSRKDDYCYTVDAANWQVVAPPPTDLNTPF